LGFIKSSSSDVRFVARSGVIPERFGAIGGYDLRCHGTLDSVAEGTDEEGRWRDADGRATGEKVGMNDCSELPGYEQTSGV